MACNTSMVRWHRYNSYGNNINANYEYRWHAALPVENFVSLEKILPKSKEISVILFVHGHHYLICAVFYKIFGMITRPLDDYYSNWWIFKL